MKTEQTVQGLQAFAFCVVNVNSTVVFKHFEDFKERRDNPEKVGGVDVEIGGCHFCYYFTVQLHLLCVCGKK